MHRQLQGLPWLGNIGVPAFPYFPLFCLVRAGVHVPPFTDHLAFHHPIQDHGFTPENWKRWVQTLVLAKYIREYYSIFDTLFDRRHRDEGLAMVARYFYQKVEAAFGTQPTFGQRLTVPPEFMQEGFDFLNHWCFGDIDSIRQWLTDQFTEFNALEEIPGDEIERKPLDQMLLESRKLTDLDQKARELGRCILTADIVYSKPCFYFINPEYLLVACRNKQEQIDQLTLALEVPQ